ncbi:translocation/assembly module TamB domain-containing protein [Chitinispirillales bacterium ANBcel5]|uniref:translocation/assembly module TamB domain-containing protein n=1 Tax=Cellulosispirillum alkaliphilum TaxID=3039283 RepID=UPI002A55DF6C|nr:translocation/assembly module TamB domain-containing protein [Chitinispirillales bacterium ANBcel5]
MAAPRARRIGLKIGLFIIVSASIIVLFLIFLISLEPVRREILNRVEGAVNEEIVGEIRIGDFQTDLFTTLTLQNIRAGTGEPFGDTLYLEMVTIRYFIPALLTGRIQITEITAQNGEAFALLDNEGTLRFPLIPVGPPEPEPDPLFEFFIDTLEFTDFDFRFSDLQSDIHTQLLAFGSLSLQPDTIRATIPLAYGWFNSPLWNGPIDSIYISGSFFNDEILNFEQLFVKADSAIIDLAGDIPAEPYAHWDLYAHTSIPLTQAEPALNGGVIDLGGRLNVDLTVNGPQLSPFGSLISHSENIIIEDFEIDTLLINSTYSLPDSIQADLTLRSPLGDVDAYGVVFLKGSLEEELSLSDYEFSISSRDIDISDLLELFDIPFPIAPIRADVDVYILGDDDEPDIPHLAALEATFHMPPPLEDEPFRISGALFENEWEFRGVTGRGNDIDAAGMLYSDTLWGDLSVSMRNLELLSSLFISPSATGALFLESRIGGWFDALYATLGVHSPGIQWYGIQLDTLVAELRYAQDVVTINRSIAMLSADLSEAGPMPPQADGKVWATFGAQGDIADLRAYASVHGENVAYEHQRVEQISASLAYYADTLALEELLVLNEGFSVESRGTLILSEYLHQFAFLMLIEHEDIRSGVIRASGEFDDDYIQANVSVSDLRTAPFLELAGAPIVEEGSLNLRLSVQGPFAFPDGSVSFELEQNLSGDVATLVDGEFLLFNDTLIGSSFIRPVVYGAATSRSSVVFSVNLPLRHQIDSPLKDGSVINVTTHNFPLGTIINSLFPRLDTHIILTIDAMLLKHDQQWELNGTSQLSIDTITIPDEELHVYSFPLNFLFDGTISEPSVYLHSSEGIFRYEDLFSQLEQLSAVITPDHIELQNFEVDLPDEGFIRAEAFIPLQWPDDRLPFYGLRGEFEFNHANLQFFTPFLPEVDIASGTLNGKGSVSVDTLVKTSGYTRVDSLVLEHEQIDRSIGPFFGELLLAGDVITLETRGSLGGPISAQGRFVLSDTGIDSLEFNLLASDLRFRYNNQADIGIASLNLSAIGSENRVDSITGGLTFGETRYYQYVELIDVLEQIRATAVVPEVIPPAFLDESHLFFDLFLNRNLIVKTNIGRALLTGRVIISGTPSAPYLDGEVRLAEARIKYLERETELREGFLRQFDLNLIDPLIDLTSDITIRSFLFDGQRDYELGVALSGSIFEPNFILTAHPPLEEEQIINLLTTGTITALPDYITEPAELISIYTSAAVAWRIREWLGITNVNIGGNLLEFTGEDGPVLTLTEMLTERTCIMYNIRLGQPHRQGLRLTYQVLPYLYINSSGTTEGTGNLGLWLYIRR